MFSDVVLDQEERITSHATILACEDLHTSGAYGKRQLAIVEAEGERVTDAEGRQFVDMTSGHGVALLGHRHPAILDAIHAQANRVITCSEIFYNDQRAALYQCLQTHLPPRFGRYFLCNSGAEAIEGAIKLARALTQRPGIVAMKGGFHGRSLGALSATWRPKYREPFEPLVPGFRHANFNDFESLAESVDETTAAVIIEVIQGEGGIRPVDNDFLLYLRALCTAHGALLIFDEIQTGLGRTGRWFGFQHFDVTPDVICLGKGIAGGLPMGIVAWRSDLGTFPKHSHGSTFGGNPLACAAAIATLYTLDNEGLPARAAEIGDGFIEELRAMQHPLVREVRGRGLMIGIDLRKRATPVLMAMMDRGVLALPAGSTVVRLLPPLTVARQALSDVHTTLVDALQEVYGD